MTRFGLLLSILLTAGASGFAKDKNPADYPLHVNLLSVDIWLVSRRRWIWSGKGGQCSTGIVSNHCAGPQS